jgi:hypothetical protein
VLLAHLDPSPATGGHATTCHSNNAAGGKSEAAEPQLKPQG